MKPLRLALFLLITLATGALAGPKKKGGGGGHEEPMHKVNEVSPAAITLVVGKSDDVHETFRITAATKITLDGVAVPADVLRAGMEARVKANPDKTAESIEAKGAVAHPAKHRVG